MSRIMSIDGRPMGAAPRYRFQVIINGEMPANDPKAIGPVVQRFLSIDIGAYQYIDNVQVNVDPNPVTGAPDGNSSPR